MHLSISNIELDPTGHYAARSASPGRLLQACGYIPAMLEDLLPGERARDCLDRQYKHGGGWDPFKGFAMSDSGVMTYPEDPPLYPIASFLLENGELVYMYQYSWVAIVQPNGDFEVARMD